MLELSGWSEHGYYAPERNTGERTGDTLNQRHYLFDKERNRQNYVALGAPSPRLLVAFPCKE
jgi:hypothetical protein